MSQDKTEARFAELEALAIEFAQAQAQADHLSEFRKSKKAMLMKEAELKGSTSAAIQEREAYRHGDYIELLNGLKVATERALSAKWRLELARMRFEWSRTQAANRRAEMNLR
jgi:hypothetical protein